MQKDLTLLIPTCNAFSDIWPAAFSFLKQNWSSSPIIMVSDDGLPGNEDGIQLENTGLDKLDFSGRLFQGLELVKTEYVCFMLDDYFIVNPIDDDDIGRCLAIMKEHDLDYLHFDKTSGWRKFPKTEDPLLRMIKPNEVYAVNTCPGLWKTESLKKILVPGETAWESEVRMTSRFAKSQLRGGLYLKNPLPYLDGVRKGKFLPGVKKRLQRQGLYSGDRPNMSRISSLLLSIRHKAAIALPSSFRNTLRKLFGGKKTFYRDKAE